MWMCLHEESSFQANYYHYHRIWTMHGPAGWPGSDPGVAPQKTVFLPAACTHWVWLGLGFHHDKITTSALKLLKALHCITKLKKSTNIFFCFCWKNQKHIELTLVVLSKLSKAEGQQSIHKVCSAFGLAQLSKFANGNKWCQTFWH